MTFTINKEYSISTIKAPRNSAKICPKLTKTSKRHARHCFGIVAVMDREQVVEVQLIFKNVWRKKKGL